MDIDVIKVDSTAAKEGRWVDNLPEMKPEVRLMVRGMSTPEFAAAQSRLQRQVTPDEKLANGDLKPDIALRIMGTAIVEAVLLDWEGLTSGGKKLPYSEKTAIELMTDRNYRKFQDAVVYASRVVDNGRAAADEELMGNSSSSSDGSQESPR